MKKNQFKLAEFIYGQKTAGNLTLKQDRAIRTFSIVSIFILISYLVIYNTLYPIQPTNISTLIVTFPLILSVTLLITAYKEMYQNSLFIITLLLSASMIAASFHNPEISYPKLILIYILVSLFYNSSKQQQLSSFLLLMLTYIVIQLRYYYIHIDGIDNRFIFFEIIILPLLSLVIFLVLSKIKNDLSIYQYEIKAQKEMLERRNNSLEALVTFSEHQKNKLKLTALLKEKLLTLISHDIRVPLNSYKMLIDNYEKGFMTDKMVIEGIVESKKSLNRIDAMVYDLISWSADDNQESGTKFANKKKVTSSIDSVLLLYGLSAKNKSLAVETDVEMPDNMCLSIPKREFEVILRNLLSNAIKFSHPGGRILISLKTEPGISSATATLLVKDFGTGFHPETLKRLNYNKISSMLGTFDEAGLGVGLSIVFDIVHNNSLQYNIESMENHGTEFSITFPLVSD